MNKKKLTIWGLCIAIPLLLLSIYLYSQLFASNTNFSEKEIYIKIPTNATYQQAKQIIAPYLKNVAQFEAIAQKRSYPEHVKAGRFLIQNNMGNWAIVTALRKNVAVKLAFNNQERLEDLVGRVSHQIEADSTALLNTIKEPGFLQQNGFTPDNVLVMFIPNTYEMYWNTSAEKFRDKMIKEYHKYWTKDRIAKAQQQQLTPIQATILASIVHKESVKKDERPRIAAVYLNRLKLEMPLQADPTVIFALKKNANDFDQVIKRVLYDDLKMASPYNTYLNLGLPPGPIAMPDITALEAVLNPEKNDYLFFCASVSRFGYHEFATTLAEHDVNRKKYTDWVSSKGINR